MRFRLHCSWLLCGLAFLFLGGCAKDDREFVKGKDGRVLRIFNEDQLATGSGFVVSKEGHVITNWHVLRDGDLVGNREFSESVEDLRKKRVFVCWSGAEEGEVKVREAKLIAIDRARDLALLKIENLDLEPIPLHMGSHLVEEEVRAMGYPGVADEMGSMEIRGKMYTVNKTTIDFWNALKEQNYHDVPAKSDVGDFVSLTVTKGAVENVRDEKFGDGSEKVPSVRHGAAISFGNSGGPLVNACNEVVGVNTQGKTDDGAGRVQTALHVSALQKFLEREDVPFVKGSTSCRPYFGLILWSSIGFGFLLLGSIGGFFYFKNSNRSFAEVKKTIVQGVSKRLSGLSDGGAGYLIDELIDEVAPKTFARLILEDRDSALSFQFGEEDFARNRQRVLIGRSPILVHQAIQNETLSKQHAAIALRQNGFEVEDLGTANGTWLEGVRLSPRVPSRVLKNEDCLKLGNLSLVVKIIVG